MYALISHMRGIHMLFIYARDVMLFLKVGNVTYANLNEKSRYM